MHNSNPERLKPTTSFCVALNLSVFVTLLFSVSFVVNCNPKVYCTYTLWRQSRRRFLHPFVGFFARYVNHR